MRYKHLSQFSNDLIDEYMVYLFHNTEYDSFWKTQAMNKFIKGREEHEEQDIMDIDVEYEIMMEEIDINAYEFIGRVQQRIKDEKYL